MAAKEPCIRAQKLYIAAQKLYIAAQEAVLFATTCLWSRKMVRAGWYAQLLCMHHTDALGAAHIHTHTHLHPHTCAHTLTHTHAHTRTSHTHTVVGSGPDGYCVVRCMFAVDAWLPYVNVCECLVI